MPIHVAEAVDFSVPRTTNHIQSSRDVKFSTGPANIWTHVTTSIAPNCLLCKEAHALNLYPTFKSFTLQKRIKFVLEKML